MTKTSSPPRAKRRTLFDIATMSAMEKAPVQAVPQNHAAVRRAAPGRANYPSATVYLPRRALRLIKEIALEENRRISDIIADAVDEYLAKRGHPSLTQLSD
jgi:hypothetical protein